MFPNGEEVEEMQQYAGSSMEKRPNKPKWINTFFCPPPSSRWISSITSVYLWYFISHRGDKLTDNHLTRHQSVWGPLRSNQGGKKYIYKTF